MKPKTLLLLFSFFFVQSIYGQFSLSVFPADKFYEKYYADAIAHQFSLSKNFETSEWFGNIGAILPLIKLKVHSVENKISAGATVFNTLIKTPGHIKVYTVDYLVDFYLDTKLSQLLISRLIWGHLSAHYSDDGIEQLSKQSINYARDYVGLHLEHLIPLTNGKVYAGCFYNFHNEPAIDKHYTIQLGGDASILILFNSFNVYAAFDLKIKSEVNNGTTRSFQIGMKYPAEKKEPSVRIAFTHREGFEERGQLYNMKDNKNFIGLFFDF
ncbi:MAG: DUF1207 domain-containing protein [Bacteroidota bacterium]